MMENDERHAHWTAGHKYAIEGAKTLLLINGGGAIALLAFVGNQIGAVPKAEEFSSAIGCSLFLLGVGALSSAIIFTCAYLTQLQYGNNNHNRASHWHWAAYAAAAISMACFLSGLWFARVALLVVLNATAPQ